MNKTKQRQLIMDLVQQSYDHPTADDVFRVVRQTIPNISLGTVYRNLGVLTDTGAIRKISVPAQADHFDRNTQWHDHMVCVDCGRMFDVNVCSTPTLIEQLAAQSGMRVLGYSLVAQCLCAACAGVQGQLS